MNILILANHFNTGGITSYVLTLARGFVRQGHSVHVVSSGGNMTDELEVLGARHHLLPFNVKSEIHPRLIRLVPALAGIIYREKIGIMHAQTRVTQMAAALAGAMTTVPYVSTCHGFFRPHWGRRLFPLWGARAIAISCQVENHLVNDLRCPTAKVVCVPNGIELSLFSEPSAGEQAALRRRWKCEAGPNLGIVARLSDVKGHQYLIAAMPKILAEVPSARCLIFGEGPLHASLISQAAALSLQDRVCFYPVVNRTAEVLPLLDVFVLPSIQEGLGLSVLEASAMGVPAVVSRVGGLPAVVRDGETGILVPPADVEALAAAVVSLLRDLPRARKMGQEAKSFVHRSFSAERMVASTLRVYQEVLERKA